MRRSCRFIDSMVLLGVTALSSLWIAGCVVVPDQRHYPGGIVMVAPPPPRVEIIGSPPDEGYVWLAGYWNWVGDRHEWVPGHWERRRPGRHWIGAEWVRQGDGWRLRRGHWGRD